MTTTVPTAHSIGAVTMEFYATIFQGQRGLERVPASTVPREAAFTGFTRPELPLHKRQGVWLFRLPHPHSVATFEGLSLKKKVLLLKGIAEEFLG